MKIDIEYNTWFVLRKYLSWCDIDDEKWDDFYYTMLALSNYNKDL